MSNPRICCTFLLFSAMLVMVGCERDDSAADRRVSENIQSSREAAYKKGDDAQAKSYKLLESAAKETAASPASKATAKAMLAQSNYASAVALLPEVNKAENEAQRVIREMGRVGAALSGEASLIGSLKGANPSASASDPVKALSANKAKFAGEVAELDKTLSQLTAQQQALTSKINNLETEQKSKLELSNGLMQKSEQAKGEESLNLFKQSTAVRQNASMLARDLEFARIDLKRTEALIADAQNERKSAEDSMKVAQGQIEQLNAGWAATEAAIKNRQSEAGTLLARPEVSASIGMGITAESGLAALAKQLAAAKEKSAALRKEIDEKHLEVSIAAYDEANNAAKKLMTEISANLRDPKSADSPAKIAWQRIERLYDPITFQLGKARSLELRGQLSLGEKNLLKAQQNLVASLTPSFQKAGLTMPPELAPADLAQQLDAAQKNAVKDLTDSESLLKDILETDKVQRNIWAQTNEARQLFVSVEYSLHYLEPDKGHLDAARAQMKLLADNGAIFPALPTDLETRKITPVPILAANNRPTTNPTATTTTDNAAPQPAPSTGGSSGSSGTGGGAWSKLLKKAGGAFGQPKSGDGTAPPVPPPNQ